MKTIYISALIFTFFCTAAFPKDLQAVGDSAALVADKAESIVDEGFDFFASEEPLQMTLYFDIRTFVKTKKDPENLDAILTIALSETDSVSQQIKIKARGEMRRAYCTFPPISLRFKDNKDEEEPILSNGNMKLVTHCNQSSSFENYVLKEYLAYKLYNLVTPYSFRVRLAVVHYRDIDDPKLVYTEYGFLIENDNQLAGRNHVMIVDNQNLVQKHMNEYDMARVAVFNYMIGNTDWSVQQQHNIKVFKSLEVVSGKGIPVAYDFDYSGFVNTRYSAPNEKLTIKYVTDRYYMGQCLSGEEINMVMHEFEQIKDDVLQIITDFAYLSKGTRKQALSYINGFFKQYSTPRALLSELNKTCIKE